MSQDFLNNIDFSGFSAFAPHASAVPPFLGTAAYLSKGSEEPEWLVKDWLPKGRLIVLSGDSKSGKTALVTNLAAAVATGSSFLGLSTNCHPVLWLAYEESPDERREILGCYADLALLLHPEIEQGELPLLDTAQGIAQLESWITETGAALIIVDPLYSAIITDSLAHGKQARDALTPLKRMCCRLNVSALVIHHLNKNQLGTARDRVADSHQILATASMDVLMMANEEAEGRDITLHMKGRGRYANGTWAIHSRHESDFSIISRSNSKKNCFAPQEQRILRLLVTGGSSLTSSQVAAALAISPAAASNALKRLHDLGSITRHASGRQFFYRAGGL